MKRKKLYKFSIKFKVQKKCIILPKKKKFICYSIESRAQLLVQIQNSSNSVRPLCHIMTSRTKPKKLKQQQKKSSNHIDRLHRYITKRKCLCDSMYARVCVCASSIVFKQGTPYNLHTQHKLHSTGKNHYVQSFNIII